MKICTSRIAFVVGCSFVASHASAQSSVTLYGIVDTGFVYTNNQKGNSAFQMASGNVQGSRFGLTGSEDLGHGLKAILKLENGFNVNTGTLGQGGRMFGRQAYVGLSDNKYGALTMGRQYQSVQDTLPYAQIAGISPVVQYASAVYDNDSLNNTYRTNNSVKYTSPWIAGFKATGLYAFSNAAGAFADNREWSAGLSYINGPFRADAAYLLSRQPGSTAGGALASDNYYSLGASYITNVTRNQVYGAGASYQIGIAKLALLYTNSHFNLKTNGAFRFANYEAAVNFTVSPAVNVGIGYIYTLLNTSNSTFTNAHFHQVNFGASYALSKRTNVFYDAIYQRASGANAWIDNLTAPSSGRNQLAVIAGIKHNF